jgi:hypothetical protein
MSIDQVKKQLELSESRWEAAVREHAQPPPDAGFARRLRALADAAAQEQVAYLYATDQGCGWRPGPTWLPPRELRPAAWRESLARADGLERAGNLAGIRGAVDGRVGARRRGRAHAAPSLALHRRCLSTDRLA